MLLQPCLDPGKPNVELLRAAAIHGGKASDHAVAARRNHKLDAGDQKHRRGDERQAQAIAKTAELLE
jgi:hypothetical protein